MYVLEVERVPSNVFPPYFVKFGHHLTHHMVRICITIQGLPVF